MWLWNLELGRFERSRSFSQRQASGDGKKSPEKWCYSVLLQSSSEDQIRSLREGQCLRFPKPNWNYQFRAFSVVNPFILPKHIGELPQII